METTINSDIIFYTNKNLIYAITTHKVIWSAT